MDKAGAAESASEMPENAFRRAGWIVYAAAIFLGAFLMFMVQPMAGKIVAAKFGGGANIWSVCLLFFQTVLLAGYTLTFFLSKLPTRMQAIVYAGLMLCSIFFVNIPGPSALAVNGTVEPTQELMIVLTTYLALPCLLLSSVSGMIQTWFRLSKYGNPYPLYSLSNVGSLGALLSYPVIVEPSLSLSTTLNAWRWGYIVLTMLIAAGSFNLLKVFRQEEAATAETVSTEEPESKSESPGMAKYFWWLLLSCASSICLVSYSSYLTQDIAPIPFLCVVPLALYLLTFIICFEGRDLYKRKLYLILCPVLWALECAVPFLWLTKTISGTTVMAVRAAAVLAFVFCFSMLCQGELAKSKPIPKHLAGFYLALAVGGALGGILVNFLAPVVFDMYSERYVIGAFVLLVFAMLFEFGGVAAKARIKRYAAVGVMTVAYMIFTLFGTFHPDELVCQQRNFYGCISVLNLPKEVVMIHGTTTHGKQYKDSADKHTPTTYYRRDAGFGLAEAFLRRSLPDQALHFGIIGLGAGTMAVYGKPGDTMTFYELDPKVEQAARKYFTFLSDSQAKTEIRLGDGRTTLEKEPAAGYDALVIDAFSGDSVPLHLLTKEAFALYLKHLKPGGLIVIHISNRYLDLEPAIGNTARALNLKAFSAVLPAQARYVILSTNQTLDLSPQGEEEKSRFKNLVIAPIRTQPSLGVWSDDYSNLMGALGKGN